MAASLRRLPTVPSYRACQKARPTHFDIVLSDAVMPEMDGLMLAAEIRKVRPELPILLMTAHNAPMHGTMLREAGVRTVLKKPVRSMDLATAIAAQLAVSAMTLHPGIPSLRT